MVFASSTFSAGLNPAAGSSSNNNFKRVMQTLDENSNIIRWASEEIVVPYISPIDNRPHRYFVDFYVEAKAPDGSIKKMLLEVKPAAQTKPPASPKRRTKRYISEVMTYGVNEAKWKAAKEFCDEKGWEFRIITEAELFKKPKIGRAHV